MRELDRGRYAPLPQAVTDDASPDALADPSSAELADTSVAGVASPLAVLGDLDRITLLLAHLTPRQRAAIEHRYGLGGREPATTWRMLAGRLRVGAIRAKELHDAAVERLRQVVAMR